MKNFLLFIIFLYGTTYSAYSQDNVKGDGVVSFSMPVRNSLKFNRHLINPTFSFVREQNSTISFYNKRQWVQFDNAPQTFLFGYAGRLRENEGVGVALFQQNYGVMTTFGVIGNFAHNVMLQEDSNLTFGANVGFYKSGLNQGKIITNDISLNIDNIPSNSLVTINPGINYGNAFLDVGLSVNNLMLYNFATSEMVKDDPEKAVEAHLMYTGYINTYGFFDRSKFSGILKSEFKKDKTVISGLAMISVPKGFWAQAGYNTLYGISAGLGVNITPKIAIEYNYEKGTGDFSTMGASHEFVIAYKLKSKKYYYGEEDEEGGLIDPPKSPKRDKTKEAAKAKADIEAKNKLAAENKAKADAETQAKVKADMEAQNKLVAENKAKADAEIQARVEKEKIEAKATADTEAKNKLAAENKAKVDAETQARVAKEKIEAKAKADTEEQNRLAAENKAKTDAETQVRLEAEKAEVKAKADAEEQNRLAAENKAKADAGTQVRVDKEKAAAIAKAQLETDAVAMQAKLAADNKTKADAEALRLKLAVGADKDDTTKSIDNLLEGLQNLNKTQGDLLSRLNTIVAKKQKDLDDMKEEFDLNQRGIYKEPKVFTSVATENKEIETLKGQMTIINKQQGELLTKMANLFKERLKKGSNKNDALDKNTVTKMEMLKVEQLNMEVNVTDVINSLEKIKEETETVKKRRIKLATFENDEDRYLEDLATLKRIKETTKLSTVPLTSKDFDCGDPQSNMQIIKNVKNKPNGYYVIIASHINRNKRDEFLTKVVATGQSDVDFFYDVNSSKYYIFSYKYDYLDDALMALKSKGNRPYDKNMFIVKVENN